MLHEFAIEDVKKEESKTGAIIGAAIEVHRHLGPGLLESIYEKALCRELYLRKIPFESQVNVDLEYIRNHHQGAENRSRGVSNSSSRD